MTFQLPEPAQVVETCTGNPVYVMFNCEFTNTKLIQNNAVTEELICQTIGYTCTQKNAKANTTFKSETKEHINSKVANIENTPRWHPHSTI